jgi:hypothetical protein
MNGNASNDLSLDHLCPSSGVSEFGNGGGLSGSAFAAYTHALHELSVWSLVLIDSCHCGISFRDWRHGSGCQWTKSGPRALPLGASEPMLASKPLVFLTVRVTEKQARNGEQIVFCDVMLSNDEGERSVQGTAQVALPSRAA